MSSRGDEGFSWSRFADVVSPIAYWAGERATGLVRSMADEEAKVGATTMEFYRNSLPAVPLLLVGFLFGEGVELVRTPLSLCGPQKRLQNPLCFCEAFHCSTPPHRSKQLT